MNGINCFRESGTDRRLCSAAPLNLRAAAGTNAKGEQV